MASLTDRCPDCDAPLATDEHAIAHVEGCECAACCALCWRAWCGDRCQREPHDWRAEAMALREEVALLRALERGEQEREGGA